MNLVGLTIDKRIHLGIENFIYVLCAWIAASSKDLACVSDHHFDK